MERPGLGREERAGKKLEGDPEDGERPDEVLGGGLSKGMEG